MPRIDIEFQTHDLVTLRGWFYSPTDDSPSADSRLPCLILSHGFSALKEMDLDAFADHFTANLPISCLVYDNRGFGASDTAVNAPRHEIIPSVQCSDMQDAITYAQSRVEVDPERIGIWGSSYSGGHVLWVGAIDKRVKAVLSQVPCVNGYENFHRLIRPDYVAGLNAQFQADRLGRLAGERPQTLPVVDADPKKPSALPTADSYDFFSSWAAKSKWVNEVTLKSVEAFREYNASAHIAHISPAPLLMTVAENDVLTPTDLALEAYSRALEPKEVHILPGGHFEGYTGRNFERNLSRQTEFLRKTLCK